VQPCMWVMPGRQINVMQTLKKRVPSGCGSTQKERKRKDYAFWRQFNENPSIIPGCPGVDQLT